MAKIDIWQIRRDFWHSGRTHEEIQAHHGLTCEQELAITKYSGNLPTPAIMARLAKLRSGMSLAAIRRVMEEG